MHVAIGIALSLLLHLLAAIAVWHSLPQNQLVLRLRTPLQVRLVPSSPPLEPALSATAPLRPQPGTRTAMHTAKVQKNAIAPSTIVSVAKSAESATLSTPSASTPEHHLDMAKVRAGIGAAVAEVDREQSDTPVGQLKAKPLYDKEPESKEARAIASSARSDCRDRIANTGLLAPLMILATAFDGKDSGCKW